MRVQPGQPISARVAQIIERDASNIEDEGETPPTSAIFKGVMSVADGLAWNEEDGSAILSTLTIFRKAGRYLVAVRKDVRLSRKQDPWKRRVGALLTRSGNP